MNLSVGTFRECKTLFDEYTGVVGVELSGPLWN
jgi:hypothetical protein